MVTLPNDDNSNPGSYRRAVHQFFLCTEPESGAVHRTRTAWALWRESVPRRRQLAVVLDDGDRYGIQGR